MPETQQTVLLTDILEKMIDCQIANTQAMTAIKSTTDDLMDKCDEIAGHFTNGFRSEIKEHVTQELKKITDSNTKTAVLISEIEKEIQSLKTEIKEFKTAPFWSKVVLGLVGAIGAIAAAVYMIVDAMKP